MIKHGENKQKEEKNQYQRWNIQLNSKSITRSHMESI